MARDRKRKSSSRGGADESRSRGVQGPPAMRPRVPRIELELCLDDERDVLTGGGSDAVLATGTEALGAAANTAAAESGDAEAAATHAGPTGHDAPAGETPS